MVCRLFESASFSSMRCPCGFPRPHPSQRPPRFCFSPGQGQHPERKCLHDPELPRPLESDGHPAAGHQLQANRRQPQVRADGKGHPQTGKGIRGQERASRTTFFFCVLCSRVRRISAVLPQWRSTRRSIRASFFQATPGAPRLGSSFCETAQSLPLRRDCHVSAGVSAFHQALTVNEGASCIGRQILTCRRYVRARGGGGFFSAARSWPHSRAVARTAPHRTAPHRTAPHRTAPHRSA